MPAQPIKLPYGLRDGVLLHVSDVDQGASCGCTCPGCGAPLLARKGSRNVHHFAHSSADCGRGIETALHRAAKEAIEAASEFLLPAVQLRLHQQGRPWTISGPQLVRPDSVRLESRIGGIVPDILLTVNGRELLVEVRVTHAVDSTKLEKIRELDLSVLEISLDHLPRDLPIAELKAAVLYGEDNREWLHNSAASRLGAEIRRLAHGLPHQLLGGVRYVDHCPINASISGKHASARVGTDCFHCEFCLETDDATAPDGAVLCLGHVGSLPYSELRKRVRASVGREA